MLPVPWVRKQNEVGKRERVVQPYSVPPPELSELAPVPRCPTRRSSTHAMVARYLELLPIIATHWGNLRIPPNLLLSPEEQVALAALGIQLGQINPVVVRLQREDLTLLEARTAFDVSRQQYVGLNHYLHPEYTNPAYRNFESGLVKLQEDNHHQLTVGEALVMERFRKPVIPAQVPPVQVAGPLQGNLVDLIDAQVRQRRDAGPNASPYVDTKFVQATSDVVERCFSAAKLISTPQRNFPSCTLEILMMLRMNRSRWNVDTVAGILKPPAPVPAAAPAPAAPHVVVLV
jgi:hypothetical protein